MNLKNLSKLEFNAINFKDLGNFEVIAILFNNNPNKTEKPLIEVINSDYKLNSELIIRDLNNLVIKNLVENYISQVKIALSVGGSLGNVLLFTKITNDLAKNIINWPISCKIEETGFWIFKKPVIVIRPTSTVYTEFPTELFTGELVEKARGLQYTVYQITLIPQDNATKEKIKDLVGREIVKN